MLVTYYSTQRPIDIGTIPRLPKPKVIENFDERTYVDDIGRYAWGRVQYDEELDSQTIKNYELVKSTKE